LYSKLMQDILLYNHFFTPNMSYNPLTLFPISIYYIILLYTISQPSIYCFEGFAIMGNAFMGWSSTTLSGVTWLTTSVSFENIFSTKSCRIKSVSHIQKYLVVRQGYVHEKKSKSPTIKQLSVHLNLFFLFMGEFNVYTFLQNYGPSARSSEMQR